MEDKKKKIKIKFQLVKFNKGFSFQIIEQTDKFLNTDESKRIMFKNAMNLTLVSEHVTKCNLNDMELHLWGAYEQNRDEIAHALFTSDAHRDEWHDYILETFEDWANNCESFKEENEEIGEYLFVRSLGNNLYEI